MRRGRRGRNTDDLAVRAEINVTSLVDVAFVLLIIFIITAPIMQGGVEVNLPRGDVQPLTADEKPFFVTVQANGRVFVEGTEFSLPEFETSFPQLAAAGAFERVYIKGDSLADYGSIVHVMTTISRTGKQFSFVVGEQETPR